MKHAGQEGFYIDHDGVRLLGTIFLAQGDQRKPTALLLHGIPGVEKNVDLAHALRRIGWNAVIFHYRGCWGSSGSYNIHTIPGDVRAVTDWLASGNAPFVDPEQIIVIGHSLGGWAAVISAAQDKRLKAIAALGTISDPPEFPLAEPQIAADYAPLLSGITPDDLAAQWATLDKNLNPLEQVQKLSPRPLLILHGSDDSTVPLLHARRLFDAANSTAGYVEIPESDHSFSWHRKLMIDIVLEWAAAVKRTLPFARSGVVYRPLTSLEITGAQQLLSANGLPLEGFPDDTPVILGAFVDDRLCGCAALEIHGAFALLRSVAVDSQMRGRQIGTELTRAALIHAAARGQEAIYLLTETATDFFKKFGFVQVPRSKVPRPVRQSIEFTTACPDTAVAMRLSFDD